MLKISYKLLAIVTTMLIPFLFVACDNNSLIHEKKDSRFDLTYTEAGELEISDHSHTGGAEEGIINEELAAFMNEKIAELGISGIAFAKAETIKLPGNGSSLTGQTLYASDRVKQIPYKWLPGDERRNADGDNLTYLIFEPLSQANTINSLPVINSAPIFDSAVSTWDSLNEDSGPDIIKRMAPGVIPSFLPAVFFGLTSFTSNTFAADIGIIGFVPGLLFDIFEGPGASDEIIAVTLTFLHIEDGILTDDIAHVEIWFNENFSWGDNDTPDTIDIETIALHEFGHALGFDHFGRIALVNANGRLVVAPRAVMNAVYLGPQRELLGTDKASFNQRYDSWPFD